MHGCKNESAVAAADEEEEQKTKIWWCWKRSDNWQSTGIKSREWMIGMKIGTVFIAATDKTI